MIVQLLTEHHLEFLSLKAGCRGSSESTLVKMSNCWKSHAAAQIRYVYFPLGASHVAATFGVLMMMSITSFIYVILLIQVHVLLLSCLYF